MFIGKKLKLRKLQSSYENVLTKNLLDDPNKGERTELNNEHIESSFDVQ